MDLCPRIASYKANLTQGDRLNRIKVIRKRNKHNSKGECERDQSNRYYPSELANSYPRVGLNMVGNGSGSALDFREIYNLHYEPTDDGLTNADFSEAEPFNKFSYESENSVLPSGTYRKSAAGKANVLPSTPNASKDRPSTRPPITHHNGDSIDIQSKLVLTVVFVFVLNML